MVWVNSSQIRILDLLVPEWPWVVNTCAHPDVTLVSGTPVVHPQRVLPLNMETQYVVSELVVCLQRSLEDEINRTTIQDLPVFAVSYIIIFLYISLALGSYSRCSRIAVRARGPQRVTQSLGHLQKAFQSFPRVGTLK